MKLTAITYSPTAEIQFTRREVDFIKACSEHHYDRVCRDASKLGGFVYGMANRVHLLEDDAVSHRLTFERVDTLAKILEIAPAYMRLSPMWGLTVEEASDLTDGLRSVFAEFENNQVKPKEYA